MIIGVDVSTLRETEALGGVFTVNGQRVDALKHLNDCGASSMRVRLWVNPYENGEPYGAGGCDLNNAIALAKRAKALGMSILLDLHYSDFWCDPSRQIPPKAWQGLGLKELCDRVYAYTKEVLLAFSAEGVGVELVQTGNEITGGMLWDVGKVEMNGVNSYANLFALLKSAACAVRECGTSKIVLHLERSGDNEVYREWFNNAREYGADFDIIGISYYPFWHGDFSRLESNITDIIKRFGKPVYMVETSYPFTSEGVSSEGAPLVLSDRAELFAGGAKPYPFTEQGQADFLRSVKALCKRIGIQALYYWEPCWLPLKGATWSTEAARRYMHEEHKSGGNEWANQCLFNYKGEALPAISELLEVDDED